MSETEYEKICRGPTPATLHEYAWGTTNIHATTYTLNFGNSIVDNNEGNKMNFFSYTFSTGPTLDSLYLKGNIQDAFNLETDEYLSLQLYRIDSVYNDSIIFNYKPTSLANTLDSTNYRFNNLREGR